MHPTPTDHLPILSGIQPAELRRFGETFSLAKRGTLYQDHIFHGQLAGSPDVPQERLKSRRPFAPAARKLLNDLSKLGIPATQWTNYRWKAEYFKRTSVLHVFIPKASFRLLGMDLPKTSWVKLNFLAEWCWSFPFVNVQMRYSSLVELQMRWHRSNHRPRYHSVPHTSGASRGCWFDGFG